MRTLRYIGRLGAPTVPLIAAAALALAATSPVLAATAVLTVAVSGGGGPITGSAGTATLTANGVSFTCQTIPGSAASTATLTIPTGTHTGNSPVKIGTVTALAFNNCSVTQLGAAATITAVMGPYSLSAISRTNTPGQTDVRASKLDLNVGVPGVCAFTVTGFAPGFYTDGQHTLTMTTRLPIAPLNTSLLTVSNANCTGLVNNGDHPVLTVTYSLNRVVVIKST